MYLVKLFPFWVYISGNLSRADINEGGHYHLIIGYKGTRKKSLKVLQKNEYIMIHSFHEI